MKKRILVAPLNWGIGHACRCIPIIKSLIKANFEVIIASDSDALLLLQKEFPTLESVSLPSYNITYAEDAKNFKFHLAKQLPKIYKIIKQEYRATQAIIKKYKIDGIISDNRLGVFSKDLPSVFVTHQLQVLSGSSTYLSTKLHHYFIKKFNFCWVPDFITSPNLSGKLSHSSTLKLNISTKFIGALSRFQKTETEIKYDILVLLSGPEPQRTLLEEKLYAELKNTTYKVLFVKGTIENKHKTETKHRIEIHNFMTSTALEKAINCSGLVICRSGYTSIMDVAKLDKKAFFIPTPGQFEQEYLAQHLEQQNIAPYCNQNEFTLKKLNLVKNYSGFKTLSFTDDLNRSLFDCFI